MSGTAVVETRARSLMRDLVSLTKPRIISLLLVTTIAPMFAAGRPGWGLVLLVLVGGYLMAGGANAVNMYMDRDIDDRMARTRLRPIPSGRLGPLSVLAFGVALATAATALFAWFVNPLSAALALGGFYIYVFIYTRWLKRRSPQNIVIGGAAGASLAPRGDRGEHLDRDVRAGVPVAHREWRIVRAVLRRSPAHSREPGATAHSRGRDVSRPARGRRMSEVAAAKPAWQSFARDLVALTKPRIISLLLVTTIAPMYVAGTPSWQLVLAVFVGGYLMAGGANAVNMYMDRDIDDRMSRTRLRPIPSGRMRAEAVLAFGVLCATTATFLLAHVANILTAVLALGGFYTYVFVYTRWLKRSSPQNIVIGGAAGAFPPLVGWAAVTGRVDLFAVYLFLIIFYWTPPHFWALALLKQRDYGRAGVPMAPLVWGERETMRNMLWYTLILLPLTVLPVAFGALGIPYLIAAALLGGWLLLGVVRVMRATSYVKPAWSVYKYSLLYLALLFAAMVVDRAIA
ncbi:MAG TPA: heme o synthase [Gemmatimonadaceae bacterium]|nr:heme o synthase [Gemmatimonadaceae bacterium]